MGAPRGDRRPHRGGGGALAGRKDDAGGPEHPAPRRVRAVPRERHPVRGGDQRGGRARQALRRRGIRRVHQRDPRPDLRNSCGRRQRRRGRREVQAAGDRAEVAAEVGRGRRVPVPGRAVRAEILLPRDVPVPFRPDPHGARAGVHDRRPARALQADAGVPGASPDRLGRVRAARRKRRAPARDAPGEVDVGEHRLHAGAAEGDGDLLRLGPRVRHLFPGILQMGAALFPVDAPGRPRVPQTRHAQLVRRVPDRARQRAGEPRRDVLHPRPRRR